jgi:hypothetical protein
LISRVGAAAIVGYSAGAGRVLVVIAYRDLAGGWRGMNAWPATGLHLARPPTSSALCSRGEGTTADLDDLGEV